mmetsp:Transcript_19070/g.24725  ORF Transcript_19070/g.24725 Transcript_19070/m.24725 type:complete len:160 (-) Transcript_19070:182-661(-)
MIADAGYRVIIPDLHKGQTAVDKEEASHIMSNLDFPAAIEEVGKTADFLFSEGSSRIGIIEFCMGDALTLGSLAKHDLICAGASFYGFNQGLFRPKELNGKAVQGHFGGELIGFSDITAANKLRDMQCESTCAAPTRTRLSTLRCEPSCTCLGKSFIFL